MWAITEPKSTNTHPLSECPSSRAGIRYSLCAVSTTDSVKARTIRSDEAEHRTK